VSATRDAFGGDRWIGLAPAKVNLGLRVLAKRADGFHDLRTRMLAVEVCDRVELSARDEPGVDLALSGPFAQGVPPDARNLAWRAAASLLRLAPPTPPGGIALRLEKQVPAQAGLGGGSSDAATVLLGASALLGLDPDGAEVVRAAADLGSDVTFFLAARAQGYALAEGRGERCTPLALPPADVWIALLVPGLGASTAEVYAACRPAPAEDAGDPFEGDASQALDSLHNDLEPAALEVVPELARWRALLDDAGLDDAAFGAWRLSGSGSSFFALHVDAAQAAGELQRAKRLASERGLGWRLARVVRASRHGARALWRANGGGRP
jgi:4-diphosphocytidyl-2-C-methyl-D-erythritol kinase